jgi:hypothetical protein
MVEQMIPKATRLIMPDLRPEEYIAELLTGSGRSLALSTLECNCDVTRTVAMLLSQAEIQRELIRQDLVRSFLEVPNWENVYVGDDGTVRPDTPTAIFAIRRSLFKTIYDVSSSPEFIARYGQGPECPRLLSECVDALGDVSNLRCSKQAVNTIPIISACVVLANLTKSVEFALFLVQRKNVHLSLGLILRQREDSASLYPAIALLDRLAIPPENKGAIFAAGVIYELPRLLIDFDVQPRIQCEAVATIRKVIVGHPEHVSGIGICIPVVAEACMQHKSTERTQEQSGLLAALNLFRRTSDVELKIEIGRLVVEVCRTLFRSTGGHPERAENPVRQAFGNASDIANPITYLACNGTSKEVRGEGWFGLAAMSAWDYGRPFVMDCLAETIFQARVEEALKEGERGFSQNICLMLTKLQAFPSRLVLPATRDALERAANFAGIPPIWPLLAPAA